METKERAEARINFRKDQIADQDTHISYKKLDKPNFKALVEALKAKHTLQSISLVDCELGLHEDFRTLLDVIEKNPTLHTLNLFDCKIDGSMAFSLAQAIKVNRNFRFIYLANNRIDGFGATALATAFKKNKSLQFIDLGANHIGSAAISLLEAFETHKSLRSLYLGNNGIITNSVRIFADTLKVNHVLQSINLSYNDIGPEGAKALAAALKINRGLNSIYLGGNAIGADGAKALSDALDHNYILTTIKFHPSDNIPEDLIDKINKKLQRNVKLQTDREFNGFYSMFAMLSSAIPKFSRDVIGMIAFYARKSSDGFAIDLTERELREMLKLTKSDPAKALSDVALDSERNALIIPKDSPVIPAVPDAEREEPASLRSAEKPLSGFDSSTQSQSQAIEPLIFSAINTTPAPVTESITSSISAVSTSEQKPFDFT